MGKDSDAPKLSPRSVTKAPPAAGAWLGCTASTRGKAYDHRACVYHTLVFRERP